MRAILRILVLPVILIVALLALLSGSLRTDSGAIDITESLAHRIAKIVGLSTFLTALIIVSTFVLPATIQIDDNFYAGGHQLDPDEIAAHETGAHTAPQHRDETAGAT